MNIKIEYKYIQSNIFIVSVAYLTFLDKEIAKKKVSTRGRLVTIFYFTRPVDRKQTTF